MRKGYLTVFVLLVAVNGCSLAAHGSWGQEWSENYALGDGVQCTVPEMIDGNVGTVGKPIAHSEGNALFPYAEVEIVLPEKKAINRIVIYNRGLKTFKILAPIGEGDNWQIVKRVRKNTKEDVDIRMSVVTDRIKIRADVDSLIGPHHEFVPPDIGEIELYGFVDPARRPAGKSEASRAPDIPSASPKGGRYAGDAEQIQGIGTWFFGGNYEPLGLSQKSWLKEFGGEIRISALGLFADVGDDGGYGSSAFGIVLQYLMMYRYIFSEHVSGGSFSRSGTAMRNLLYPYVSIGPIAGVIRGKSYSESVTAWVYGFQGKGGLALNLYPVEISLDLLGYGYIGVSAGDEGKMGGFFPMRPSISVHYYF
jgi:hypothetical protein